MHPAVCGLWSLDADVQLTSGLPALPIFHLSFFSFSCGNIRSQTCCSYCKKIHLLAFGRTYYTVLNGYQIYLYSVSLKLMVKLKCSQWNIIISILTILCAHSAGNWLFITPAVKFVYVAMTVGIYVETELRVNMHGFTLNWYLQQVCVPR